MVSKFGHFTRAVVREIDATLAVQALRSDSSVSIDINKAILQHKQYVHILRNQLGLKVDVLPSNGFPDSVFIEDTSVVVGKQVLITNPGSFYLPSPHSVSFLFNPYFLLSQELRAERGRLPRYAITSSSRRAWQ